jgi:hypothetical protein
MTGVGNNGAEKGVVLVLGFAKRISGERGLVGEFAEFPEMRGKRRHERSECAANDLKGVMVALIVAGWAVGEERPSWVSDSHRVEQGETVLCKNGAENG